MKILSIVYTVLFGLLLSACVSNPVTLFESKGAKTLEAGVTLYREGQYAQALRSFQTALDLGLSSTEQVRAHKLMAFTYCVEGEISNCRLSFKKLLEVNPGFELEATEAGHPSWGPVFRQVRLGH